MKKIILAVLPVAFALTALNVQAAYVPYIEKAVQKITPSEYDQNHDGYITADEVEVELREDAIIKAITMQQEGASEASVDRVIMDMEDSIKIDAEVIINILDKDHDELVEPNERRDFLKK